MQKSILITGATDDIGLVTARKLAADGHKLLIHGRNASKLDQLAQELSHPGSSTIETYLADLSSMSQVRALADEVNTRHKSLDVLINNAGVLKAAQTRTSDGLDVRFAVNTIAPYLLTKLLMPLLGASGRIINLSSAAQSPLNLKAARGNVPLDDMSAYSQSKLAITMWSRHLALAKPEGPVIVAVNPGSLLGSKMVKEGFGIAGKDLNIGADILLRAALSDEFATASGQYFDNDAGRFTSPHPDALDASKASGLVSEIEAILTEIG